MSTWHPYYRRSRPKAHDASGQPRLEWDFATGGDIDLNTCHEPAFPDPRSAVADARGRFDDRTAAVLRAMVDPAWVRMYPGAGRSLLMEQKYGKKETIRFHGPTAVCLAALAYPDYFPATTASWIKGSVSSAILVSRPGWCGTFGPVPGGADTNALVFKDYGGGNYDMQQMHLLPVAYAYYDELTPKAQEHLITRLLAGGVIARFKVDDTYTSGGAPADWSRAGYVTPLGVGKKTIGETENHLLMTMTVRYLTNQLLYPRRTRLDFDNRRNDADTLAAADYLRSSFDGLDEMAIIEWASGAIATDEPTPGSCTSILLALLRAILRDDFSEYNAKPYQMHTRQALLNLASYAYDHEVRLAARMALDYISAHVAVSSNDLRRLVPFRRINELPSVNHHATGHMTVDLVSTAFGADSMAAFFALQAGNTRLYRSSVIKPSIESGRPPYASQWHIASDNVGDLLPDVLGDYRIPPSIHDLFVNDRHRRFFQRLHRTVQHDETWMGTPRNCDNHEIYASSPSYLISAGGEPAGAIIDQHFAGILFGPEKDLEQHGVAVTTSFMPTTGTSEPGEPDGWNADATVAEHLIQVGRFADTPTAFVPTFRNYGVAPDFMCGSDLHLPPWVAHMTEVAGKHWSQVDNFTFIDKGSTDGGSSGGRAPGFYLAIYRANGFAVVEAFDTWLHPAETFAQFSAAVRANNPHLHLVVDWTEFEYTTCNGNVVRAVIDRATCTAQVRSIEYGGREPRDSTGDAGNTADGFVSGTVMRDRRDPLTKRPIAASIEITNFDLGTTLVLDHSEPMRPRRTSEDGRVEEAGGHSEVWLDFDWRGPSRGDVCQPYTTIAAASAAVVERGVVRMIPASTTDRSPIGVNRRMTLVAPAGDVWIGVA